jgi:hypothetical protein
VGQLIHTSTALFIALGFGLFMAGCSRPSANSFPSDALDQTIAGVIGDPTTCVIIAERTTHRTLYRYGELFNCVRGLPACDRPGFLTAQQALALADTTDGRGASCPSNAHSGRRVGWAEGRVASKKRDLIYSAVMEGDRALPGQEMIARLTDAFANAGL